MCKMSDVRRLLDRQLGFQSRLEYDCLLRRLRVGGNESYYGLTAADSSHVPDMSDQDPPIFACRFAEAAGYDHILALANEDGRVAMQDTSEKSRGTLDSFQCHNNAVFDLVWRPHQMHFVTVSGDHSACLWDASSGPVRVSVFSQHTRSVKTAAFQPSGTVFATGARDGHILVWDVRTGTQPAVVLKPDNSLMNCHSSFTPKTPGSHGKRPRIDAPRAASVTGLVFQDDATLLSCGECDGNIKVWDLRKNYSIYKREPLPKHSIPYCGSSTRNGYTNLIVDSARIRLYASCMDSVIYCFNISTYNPLPEQRYVGHENSSFYIKTCLSPDGRYLVSGSSDKHAYIWSVRRARPIVRLAGHRAEVTGTAWCSSGAIATCSDDARHKLWRVHPEFDTPDDMELKGKAEILPLDEPLTLPPWGVRTPASIKRRAAQENSSRDQPPRRTKRCLASLLGTLSETQISPNKRCLASMLGAKDEPNKKSKLESQSQKSNKRSQNTENGSPKRRCLEPSISQPLLPTGIKRKSTGDEASPSKRSCHSPQPGTSKDSTPKNYEKKGTKLRSPKSPRPKVNSPIKATNAVTTVTSPNTASRALWVADLPNFVLTGEAPHLRLMSPQKPKNSAPDWLTLLRRSKEQSSNAPLPPCSPNSPPARRMSTPASEKTPKAKTRTLLKYFTIAEKD